MQAKEPRSNLSRPGRLFHCEILRYNTNIMAIIDWRTKRQIIAFLVVFLFVGSIAGVIVYLQWPKPTCTDNKQNQDEEGVDCGGPCGPCVSNPKSIAVLWTRAMKIDEHTYEAASLIENPNLFYGLPLVKYNFKLYDSQNILVATREGQTFINPQDKFVVFETKIDTGRRDASKAVMEIEPLSDWQYIKKEKPSIIVSKKNFSNGPPFPVASANLYNESLFPVKNIYAYIVLSDKDGNAMAVSSTKVESISGESNKEITFTWPASFNEIPSTSEIYTRINLFEN